MIESFRTIKKELKHKDAPLDHKWALLHAIHTTADFDMEDILYTDEGAVETLYNKVKNGESSTIVTDVTMVTSGIHKGKAHPAGIIAAPVGFVHVKESKHMVKPFKDIPKIIVEGRKGGSNLAATLCNAILTFDDAAQLKSGRDL